MVSTLAVGAAATKRGLAPRRGGAAAVSDRIGLESLPSDGKLSRSAHSLRVVHALREAIVAGGMGAGAPLVETAIARDLGVSRGPVRTALHELHAQGLVEITPTGR